LKIVLHIAEKTERHFCYVYSTVTQYCPKLEIVTEIFSLEGAEIFDRCLFEGSLNLDCKSHVFGVCTLL